MKAIIPVAGRGTRLRPFTSTVPKPLLPVAGKPILAHIIDNLIETGVDELILITGYMGDKIRAYVEKKYDLKLHFVKQDRLLGLGYAINLGLKICNNEPVLVALGDTIIETGLEGFVDSGYNTIGVVKVDDPRRFGVVEVDGRKVIGLQEKPENPKSDLAITGPYYFQNSDVVKEALNFIIEKEIQTRGEYQITDAMARMVENGAEIYISKIEGWFDCGTVDTLIWTNRHLLEHASPPEKIDTVVFIPPVFIGENAVIERSVIGPNVSIGEGAEVRDSVIADSILGDNAVAEECNIRTSVLGNESAFRGHWNRMILGDYSEGGYYNSKE